MVDLKVNRDNAPVDKHLNASRIPGDVVKSTAFL